MSYAHNQPEFMVSELAGRVKRLIEDQFGHVRVRGEISKCHVNGGSGHAYITLKDDKAVIEGVCWRGTFAKLTHKPEAGMEVIVTGRLTTYGARSQYQLVVESVEPAGEGALMAMLQARKKQLATEGLFDAARKKPLPFLPQVIGVITSPTGAVIRDILHRVSDRFPSHVLLWPVLVQGEGAAEQIAAAIEGFHRFGDDSETGAQAKFPKPDLIIVARGGGSVEDLWAFNEEIVVRAVANACIPIISGVGHETDTTLIDYASDWRAPTPTAAAEKALPVRQELALLVQEHGAALGRSIIRQLGYVEEKLGYQMQALARFPRTLQEKSQRLDELGSRLQSAPMRGLDAKAGKLAQLSAFIRPRAVEQRLAQSYRVLAEQENILSRAMQTRLTKASHQLEITASKLQLLDVSEVLKRGFVMAKDAQGKPVTSAASAASHASLSLVFHDDALPVFTNASAVSAPPAPTMKSAAPKRKKRAAAKSDLQESLF